MSEDVMSADSLVKENAELRADRALLRAYLSEARSELNDARAQSAALVEACEAVADWIETYGSDSRLALYEPTFYGIFRVYGKNVRAAAAAVRPQADALLAKMAELIMANTQVAQLNGSYMEALQIAYHALMSYAMGNGSPDLAAEVAAHILATIEKGGKE